MAGFEEHLTQLESVVERLEKGDLTLDDSVRLYEEGVKLSQACKKELEQAEGRIQVLVEGRGGKMQVAEMDEEDSEETGVGEGEDEE
jgi:exodeoxyribonuclease VII small subunit